MSEDFVQAQPVTLHELAELSREKLGLPVRDPINPVAATASFVRANPWTALAGAALLGVGLVVLSRRRPEPGKLAALRDWVGDARESLPTRREVQSFAESTGIPLLRQLGRKLHLVS